MTSRQLRLYAPAIVLFAMAVGEALSLGHGHGALLVVLAISVVLHVREELNGAG